ncbi:hypothetical protein Y032_0243g3465 [Ancylostoma ceylanicum]|uniref:Uncharacterized protein n=1 Tax=Ancylostoma ceylanicum TaxID=53326 RepID=A0A016SDC6_9BILA|nr:hypothetical protein Y032_0243g3465 [Ancylostoma ceylanicum]
MKSQIRGAILLEEYTGSRTHTTVQELAYSNRWTMIFCVSFTDGIWRHSYKWHTSPQTRKPLQMSSLNCGSQIIGLPQSDQLKGLNPNWPVQAPPKNWALAACLHGCPAIVQT